MTRDRLLTILLSVALVAGGVWLWQSGLLSDLYTRDKLVEWLRGAGVWGPLLCIAVQFVQVVIFFIPGEITQFAAGYVFGAGLGFAYSLAGIMLGSAFNFYFARLAGRPVLERFIAPATLARMDRALKTRKGKTAVFLLFLTPGMPKDAMSYAAGLSSLGLGEFIVLSGLARIPALAVSVVLGAQWARADYRAMGVTVILSALAFLAYYFYHRRRTAAGEHDHDV